MARTESTEAFRTTMMSKFKHCISRFGLTIASLGLLACGMAEDEQDDRNHRIYLSFNDEAFSAFCLEHYDLNGDARLSRYEAERVLNMDCSGAGIRFLDDMREFKNLQTLDCSENHLQRLDVEQCASLEVLDCNQNALTELRIDGLRSLAELDCSGNELSHLELRAAVSMRRLNAEGNRLTMLDVSPCLASLQARVRQNPLLETVYYKEGQQVDYETPTTLVMR